MENNNSYISLLNQLKSDIEDARLKVALTVNEQLLELYWKIGNNILIQQSAEGWGAKVIDRLAHDLKLSFPDMKGISPRNFKYMRAPLHILIPNLCKDHLHKQAVWIQLCKCRLHNCRGTTTSRCWIK